MKRAGLFITLALCIALSMVDAIYYQARAQDFPAITVTPNTVFASTTIVGEGFYGGEVTIYWEGVPIPTVPSSLYSGAYNNRNGYFTAVITIPEQTKPGEYIIRAVDSEGGVAATSFLVIDITGLEGPSGISGPEGPEGPQGTAGEPG